MYSFVDSPPEAKRLIAHLDMDAFYASVELLRYPDLRGRAVVIGGGRDHAPQVQADGTRRYAQLKSYAGRAGRGSAAVRPTRRRRPCPDAQCGEAMYSLAVKIPQKQS